MEYSWLFIIANIYICGFKTLKGFLIKACVTKPLRQFFLRQYKFKTKDYFVSYNCCCKIMFAEWLGLL